jgi:hypothetical protein
VVRTPPRLAAARHVKAARVFAGDVSVRDGALKAGLSYLRLVAERSRRRRRLSRKKRSGTHERCRQAGRSDLLASAPADAVERLVDVRASRRGPYRG